MSDVDIDAARRWIVKWSLCLVAAHATFLVLAPAFGYPLRYAQAFRLLESVVPVLVSYAGSAVAFLVTGEGRHIRVPTRHGALFNVLLQGPVYLFAGLNVVALLAFGLSNRRSAPDGTGMSVDDLARLLTIGLSVLTGITSGMVAWLFNRRVLREEEAAAPPPEKVAAR